MTPTDLPSTLAAAIRANEDRWQLHRIESLEQAISQFEATDPTVAATQTLIAMGVLTQFLEQDLVEPEREAAYLLATHCLLSAYRHTTCTPEVTIPLGLTDYYLPPCAADRRGKGSAGPSRVAL